MDGAYALLCLDSARIYGLVTGGPAVDVSRCQAVLKDGKRIGIHPAPDAVERWALALTESYAEERG